MKNPGLFALQGDGGGGAARAAGTGAELRGKERRDVLRLGGQARSFTEQAVRPVRWSMAFRWREFGKF